MFDLFKHHGLGDLGLIATLGNLLALLITACRADKEPSGGLRARRRYSISLYGLILMPVVEMMPVNFELKTRPAFQQNLEGAGLKPTHFIGLSGIIEASCVVCAMIVCAFAIGPQHLWRFSVMLLASIAAVGFVCSLEWSRIGSTYCAARADFAWWFLLPGAAVLLAASIVKAMVVLRAFLLSRKARATEC